jgi:hypothetical protein
MKRVLEPTEFPCDTSLLPDEQREGVLPSETSVDIPSQIVPPTEKDLNDDNGQILEPAESSASPVSDAASTAMTPDSMQSSDVQISESFEELSLPGDVESSTDDMQPPRPSKPKPFERPSKIEMDQFVFIDRTQDIIDDSFALYDIQESLQGCDLNYSDIKNNIEDECTDDSEKEWKRNEDIKNSLNASFLSGFDSKVETIIGIAEKSSVDETQDTLPEIEELGKELNLDEAESKMSADTVEFVESSVVVAEKDTSEQSDEMSIPHSSLEIEGSKATESKDSLPAEESVTEISPKIPEKLTSDETSESLLGTVESVIQPLSVLCQAVTTETSRTAELVIAKDTSIKQEVTSGFSEEVDIPEADHSEDVSATEVDIVDPQTGFKDLQVDNEYQQIDIEDLRVDIVDQQTDFEDQEVDIADQQTEFDDQLLGVEYQEVDFVDELIEIDDQLVGVEDQELDIVDQQTEFEDQLVGVEDQELHIVDQQTEFEDQLIGVEDQEVDTVDQQIYFGDQQVDIIDQEVDIEYEQRDIDDQQVDAEDLDLSDDSSASTQIAVSMKLGLKEP